MNSITQKFFSVLETLSHIRRDQGNFEVISYVYYKFHSYFIKTSKFILTLPIAFALITIRPFKEIYLVMLLSSRIGHFSENTELMLLSQYEEIFSGKNWYFFFEEKIVCNTQLSKMWKRVLPVIPFPRICYEVDRTMSLLLGKKYQNNPVKAYQSCLLVRDHQNLLETKEKPYIYFTQDELDTAKRKLSKLGVEKGKPFVCLLVRDAGYLDKRNPGKRLYRHHDCRNADIINYRKMALFLAEKNYAVFRMGKHVEKKFGIDHPNIIDYANHSEQCDLLDIYLPAHCDFMISTSTGLDGIAQIFRRPLLFTDLLPIFNQLQFWHPSVMYIPKKIRYKDTDNVLSFKALEKELTILKLNMQDTLMEKNMEIIPNTPEEILDAVSEMEERVKNIWTETTEDEHFQKRYLLDCFPSTIIYDEFRFSLDRIKVKIGKKFSEENPQLFFTQDAM